MQDVTHSSERGGLESLVDDNESRCKKIFKALTSNLLVAFNEDDPLEFFDNPARRYEYFNLLVKFMEIAYLTCFAVSSYLKENFLDEYFGELFEEFSLNSLIRSLQVGVSINDVFLMLDAMPKILRLNCPAVKVVCALEIEAINSLTKNLMSTIKKDQDLRFWRLICRLQRSSELLKVMLYPKS